LHAAQTKTRPSVQKLSTPPPFPRLQRIPRSKKSINPTPFQLFNRTNMENPAISNISIQPPKTFGHFNFLPSEI
jgi:hypothetical protein